MEDNTFDLNDLPIFAKVAELGGFSAASRALAMPKSSVSRSITRLEERLGVRLIERTTRNVRLTEAGEVLYRHCLRLMAGVDEAEKAVGELGSIPRGRLTVNVPFTFAHALLGRSLGKFLMKYPEIDLVLQVASSSTEPFRDGCDVAIRPGPLPDSTMIARQIGLNRLIFVASTEYVRLHGAPKSLDELGRHQVIAYRSPSGDHVVRLEGPKGPVQETLSPRVSVNDPQLIADLVYGHAGVGLLPDFLINQGVRDGSLVHVLKRWSVPPVPLFALYPSHRSMSPKVQVFLEFISGEVSAFHSAQAE